MSINFILIIMISIAHTNKNGFVTYEQADDVVLLAIFYKGNKALRVY